MSLPRLLPPVLAAALLASSAAAAPAAKPAAPAVAPAPAAKPPAELTPAQITARREQLAAQVTGAKDFAWPANRAALDQAMTKGDSAALVALYKAPKTIDELAKLMNWQRYRVWTGGDYNMAFAYSVSLWNAGMSYAKAAENGQAQAAPIANNLKSSSAFMVLYAVAISRVDGARCADRSAPEKHIVDLTTFGKAAFQYAGSLPLETRKKMLIAVLQFEQSSAPVREVRPAICRGGLTDTPAADPAKAKPAATPKGPVFVDRKEWASRQAVERQGLTVALAPLVGLSIKPAAKP